MPLDGRRTVYETPEQVDARTRAIAARRAELRREGHALAEEARRLKVVRATLLKDDAPFLRAVPPAPNTKPRAIDVILENRRLAHPGATPSGALSLHHPSMKLRAQEREQTVAALAARVQERVECGASELAAAGKVADDLLQEWVREDQEWEGEGVKRRKVRSVWRPERDALTDALYRASRANPNALVAEREHEDFLRRETAG